MSTENKAKELSLDDLADVSGGRIKFSGYAILRGVIVMAKQNGLTKETLLEEIRNSWENGCEFKQRFTDQTDADLQDVLNYIEQHW